MVRLALLAAVAYAAWRMMPRVVDENQTLALLPPPSPGNRPPDQESLADGLERGIHNG